MPLLLVLAVASFTSALSMRLLDPLVPQIARDLMVASEAVALFGTAFALPYALGQPVTGALGDTIGKARIIQVCLAMLGLASILASLAPTYESMFAARALSGLFGGGIIPVALAMVGDRFEMAARQVALSRIVMATLLAQLLSTVGSGLLASVLGWRLVLLGSGLLAVAAAALAFKFMKPRADAARPAFSLAGMRRGYAAILQSPRARVSYAAVFVEGLLIFGVAPFIAVLLERRGAGGVREAGFVIAGIGLGGIAYTLLVRRLLAATGGMLNMMRIGGGVCGAGLAVLSLGLSWPKEMVGCFVLGFGFFMLHNSLQTQATEIAPHARGSAVALFAFFFFLGSAIGPALYGLGIARLGPTVTFLCAAAAMALLGSVTALGFARAAARGA